MSEMNSNGSKRSRRWHDHWSTKSDYGSRVIPGEWELSTIVNCHKGKGDALEGENYRGLKLTDQILKVAESVIQKLIKQQVDIDRCSFVWCQDLKLKAPYLFWDKYRENIYLAKKKNLYFGFTDLEKTLIASA